MTFHAINYAWSIGQALGIIIVSALIHIGVILSWGFVVGYFTLSVYKRLSAYYSHVRTKANRGQ